MVLEKKQESNPQISIVSPVYRAENIVETFIERVVDAVTKITPDYEIILVDDGSSDRSWEKIRKICRANTKVRGIRLSRNFGQHVAINACLEFSRGDCVVLMDCDLQDDPAYIKEMYRLIDDQTDYVITIRQGKKQSLLRKVAGWFYYKVYNWLANTDLNTNIGTYSLLCRKVVDAYLEVGDYSRYYLLVLSWLGFSRKSLIVENQQRYNGKSSYSIMRLVKIAFTSITSNSEKLLNLAIITGIIYMAASVVSGVYIVIDIQYFKGVYASGWPSIFVLLLFSIGIILFCVGIAALYIGNIFTQVKGRPRYIVGEKINL